MLVASATILVASATCTSASALRHKDNDHHRGRDRPITGQSTEWPDALRRCVSGPVRACVLSAVEIWEILVFRFFTFDCERGDIHTFRVL